MNDTLAKIIGQLAIDIAQMQLKQHKHFNPKTATSEEALMFGNYLGLNLALGRIYEQVNKESMAVAGPVRIFQWAQSIGARIVEVN